jgi:hypothetical protein
LTLFLARVTVRSRTENKPALVEASWSSAGLHRAAPTGSAENEGMHIRRCSGLNLICLTGLAIGLLVGPANSRADAPPLPDPTSGEIDATAQSQITAYVAYYADQLTAAGDDAKTQGDLRSAMLKPINASTVSAVFAYDFGSQVVNKFTPLLNNPKTALNTVIIASEVDNMSTQPLLEAALGNSSPAVRYWAADGLGGILPALVQIGPSYQQALNKLEAAVTVEQDPVAAAKICGGLASANPADAAVASAVVAALGRITANYSSVAPENLEDAAQIAGDLSQVLQNNALKLDADDQLAAMTALTNLASFTAQYYAAGQLSHSQMLSAYSAIAAGVQAMNVVSGSSDFSLDSLNPSSDSAALLLKVNDITGFQNQNGLVQRLYPKVSVPPRIQTAPSQ